MVPEYTPPDPVGQCRYCGSNLYHQRDTRCWSSECWSPEEIAQGWRWPSYRVRDELERGEKITPEEEAAARELYERHTRGELRKFSVRADGHNSGGGFSGEAANIEEARALARSQYAHRLATERGFTVRVEDVGPSGSFGWLRLIQSNMSIEVPKDPDAEPVITPPFKPSGAPINTRAAATPAPATQTDLFS